MVEARRQSSGFCSFVLQVREARLAAQAAADAFDPEALAEVQLRPPPVRALVVYDDL